MPNSISVATIGFTKHSAEDFFKKLKAARVRKVIDVRLNNTSSLAGFTRKQDLPFFLGTIAGIEYVHEPQTLAPTDFMLIAFGKKSAPKARKGQPKVEYPKWDWNTYERNFLDLMQERRVEQLFKPADFYGACLLCSEHLPHECHRRLIVEYLNEKWGGVISVTHL